MKRIWAIAALGCLVLLAGCLPWGITPRLAEFPFAESDCGAGEETAQASAGPGALTFSGSYAAPTPCHILEAELEIPSPGLLILGIRGEDSGELCSQCLALIPYSGRITGLTAGEWRLRIYHEERLILEEVYQVP